MFFFSWFFLSFLCFLPVSFSSIEIMTKHLKTLGVFFLSKFCFLWILIFQEFSTKLGFFPIFFFLLKKGFLEIPSSYPKSYKSQKRDLSKLHIY